MNSRWTSVIIAVLSLFVILVAAGQIFFTGGEELSTETADFYAMEEEVPFEGVYLRDEKPIYSYGTGVLSYECEDGSKVGKSTVIARRYRSESDIVFRMEMESLQKQLEVLTNAERLIGTDNSQLEAISAQINESHSDIIAKIIDGDLIAAGEKQSALLEAMCKREITLKESEGYSEKKQALNERIRELDILISGDVTDVTAGAAGYFVSGVDGYESEIGFSSVDIMTADKIAEIIANPRKSVERNAIGKLIADYRWRIAAVIDTEKMFGIYEGSAVTLRVGSSMQTLDAEVISVRAAKDNKSVYVFECDKLNSAVASGRTARLKLVVNSYGGLRVPRKALRYSGDDERGVFVEMGQSLVFKKVNVIYWGEDYVICSQEEDDDFLKMYDKVVTEGKDLYDGKVIR